MPMQPGDLVPVSRAGVAYKATQRDVLGARLWIDGELVVDADDATANGWYRAEGTAANLPIPANTNLQVISYVPGVWTLQTAHALGLVSATNSATWMRWQAAGVWQPWQQLALLPAEQTGTGGGGGGPDYVLKAGDRMSGPLSSAVTGAWAFVGNSKPGTNDSGLYCDANGNYIFALRDDTGAITVDINSLGDAILNALLLRDLAGAAAAPLWVQPNGLVTRGTGPDLSAYVAKSGDQMTGGLANSVTGAWVFVGNSIVGTNESGLFCDADKNYILALRDKAGAITVDINSLGDATLNALLLRDLAGASTAPLWVDTNGLVVRGAAPDLTPYVQRAGDTLSGTLASEVRAGWVFVAASKAGVNESGLFASGDDNVLLGLRSADGDLTVSLDGKTGAAVLSGPIIGKAAQFSDLAGVGVVPVVVDANGIIGRGVAIDPNAYVQKTGDQMTGSLLNNVRNAWAFAGNSNPGINESGLYCDASGNYIFALRDNSGAIAVDINSNGDATLNALLLRDLAGASTAPLWVDTNGLVARGAAPDLTPYVQRTGDTMSGVLANTTRTGWVLLAETKTGVNSSGIFALGDDNYVLGLRRDDGQLTVSLDGKLGTGTFAGPVYSQGSAVALANGTSQALKSHGVDFSQLPVLP